MSLLKVNEVTDLAGVIPDGVGRIVQIVRATDTTARSTTSSSYVDVTGMSVTITPQKSDSAILIISSVYYLVNRATSDTMDARTILTDSSNTILSGADNGSFVFKDGTTREGTQILIGYSTPATTSAVTYKMRFKIGGASTLTIRNDNNTGQMYAIEVSA